MNNDQEFVWCVVANITRDPHTEGHEKELKLGAKNFSPGTKLYCFPVLWGDGGERLTVIGKHRGTRKFVKMIQFSKYIENWRVQKVFNKHIISIFENCWDSSDKSFEYATEFVESRIK